MAEVTLTVQISEDLQRQAKAAAEERGETLSDVVRTALESYVDQNARTHHDMGYDAETALKEDPLLSMRITGGPGNVAERVKSILSEATDRETGLKLP